MDSSETNCDISDYRLEVSGNNDQTLPFNFVDSLNLGLIDSGKQEFDVQYASYNEFADENLEIESARGVADDGSLGLSCGALDEEDSEPLIELAKMKKEKPADDAARIRQIRSFLKGVRTDPKWTTECPQIRISICPELSEEINESICFMAKNYDRRPKYITFTTKFWKIENVLNFVESAFAGSGKPPRRSSLMVISKNPTNSLLELAKPLLAKISSIGVRAEFGTIYAERKLKEQRKRIRMLTKDLKSYMMLEENARSLGLDVNTAFTLTKEGIDDMEVSIHWWDTIHSNNERYTVVHLSHTVFPDGMMFPPGGVVQVTEHYIDADNEETDLLPVSACLPPVGDLIEYILAHQIGETKL